MMNEVNVVINRLDLSDNHNEHAGATIASILENTTTPNQITIHIIHDGSKSFKNMDETNKNIAKYKELVERYNSKIEFYDNADTIWDDRILSKVCNKWSPICLSRLHFQQIFPDIDRIILLGYDTIIKTDIAKLIKLCPEDYSIAAVRDNGNIFKDKTYRKYFLNEGCNPEKYFNSDMIIFNLKKIKHDNNIIDKASIYLSKYYDSPWLEQDILNFVFKDDTYLLPQKYNVFPSVRDENYINQVINEELGEDYPSGYILHFASSKKPWKCYNNKYYSEYWYYLSLTPWCGNIMELLSLLYNTIPKQNEVISNIAQYIWEYPLKNKIITLWCLSIPLWINIISKYIAQLFNRI